MHQDGSWNTNVVHTWRPLSVWEDELLTRRSMQGKVALSRAEGAPGLEAKVAKGGSRRASRLEQTLGEAYKVLFRLNIHDVLMYSNWEYVS